MQSFARVGLWAFVLVVLTSLSLLAGVIAVETDESPRLPVPAHNTPAVPATDAARVPARYPPRNRHAPNRYVPPVPTQGAPVVRHLAYRAFGAGSSTRLFRSSPAAAAAVARRSSSLAVTGWCLALLAVHPLTLRASPQPRHPDPLATHPTTRNGTGSVTETDETDTASSLLRSGTRAYIALPATSAPSTTSMSVSSTSSSLPSTLSSSDSDFSQGRRRIAANTAAQRRARDARAPTAAALETTGDSAAQRRAHGALTPAAAANAIAVNKAERGATRLILPASRRSELPLHNPPPSARVWRP